MGKPQKDREHKASVLRNRPKDMSPADVRLVKNRRAKDRNAERREQRRAEADERNAFCQSLTPAQRLKRLDERLGVGIGAKKERAKLEVS